MHMRHLNHNTRYVAMTGVLADFVHLCSMSTCCCCSVFVFLQELVPGGICRHCCPSGVGPDHLRQLRPPLVCCFVHGEPVGCCSEMEPCRRPSEHFMEFSSYASSKAVPFFDPVSNISDSFVSACHSCGGLPSVSTAICKDRNIRSRTNGCGGGTLCVC